MQAHDEVYQAAAAQAGGDHPGSPGRRACALLRLGDLNPGGGANTVR
jgi:hypothetical protein